MTPDQRAHLTEIVDGMLPLIQAAQQVGSQMNPTGLPVQGLNSHTTPPTYPAATTPDRLDQAPAWQGTSWQDIIDQLIDQGVDVPEQWRVAVAVDIYQTSEGNGYVVRCSVLIDGERWACARNFGPLDWNERGWVVVPEDEV